jgi:hypothetical protein
MNGETQDKCTKQLMHTMRKERLDAAQQQIQMSDRS